MRTEELWIIYSLIYWVDEERIDEERCECFSYGCLKFAEMPTYTPVTGCHRKTLGKCALCVERIGAGPTMHLNQSLNSTQSLYAVQ